jgi:hypothetical protein
MKRVRRSHGHPGTRTRRQYEGYGGGLGTGAGLAAGFRVGSGMGFGVAFGAGATGGLAAVFAAGLGDAVEAPAPVPYP